MGQLRIGLKVPDLYLAWADYENKSGYKERAVRILKAALESNIHPSVPLHEKLVELQHASAADKENVRNDMKNSIPAHNRIPLQEKTTRFLGTSSDSSSGFLRSSSSESVSDSQKADHTLSLKGSLTKKRISSLGPPARLAKGTPKLVSPPTPESISSPHSDLADKSSEEVDSPHAMRRINLDPTMDMDLSKTIHVGSKQDENASITVCLNDTSKKDHPSTIEEAVSRMDWPNLEEVSKSKDKTYFAMHDKVYMRSQLIGKGGSCKVFKILDDNGQVYALKKVKLRGQDPTVIAGYKNEIILLNKLRDNERIINLIDADQSDGNLLMVMKTHVRSWNMEKLTWRKCYKRVLMCH
jgi:hypothetical protein